jgi:LysM repeat protein
MIKKTLIAITIILLLLTAIPASDIKAQAGSAYDLIAEVNSLRSSRGLSPYNIDSGLMSFAQTQSNYMASLGYWTHTRSDGSTAWDHGIQENVAMGTNMSTSFCVYNIWSDYVHWKTMVNYATGNVGAGVASSGDTVYYTLNVRPGEEVVDSNIVNAPVYQATETTEYISPIITSTPDNLGYVTHKVNYGETLWMIAIAYGTTMNEILINSGLGTGSTDVFAGQVLTIRTPGPATATLPPTETPIEPTPTNTPPRATRTPLPTRTPAPTSTPTPRPPFIYTVFGDTQKLGVGLISVCGLALVLVLYFGFFRKTGK